MTDDPESRFARLVVERGLARPEHVAECQRFRREAIGRGEAPPALAELLVERGYLKGRRGLTLSMALAILVVLSLLALVIAGHVRERRLATRLLAEQQAVPLLERASADLEVSFMRSYVPSGLRHDEITGHLRHVRDQIESAIRLAPHMPRAHVLLGRVLEIEGERRQAEACYRSAIEVDPADGAPHYRLGRVLLEQAHLAGLDTPHGRRCAEEAARALESAVGAPQALAGQADIELVRAMLACARGDGKEAQRIVREVVARPAGAPSEDAYWLFGLASSSARERIECFTRALQIRPGFPLAYHARGAAREEQGDLAAAISDYHAAIALQPRFPEAFRGRARARHQRGDIDGAAADYRRALEVAPADWPHRAQVEHALREIGR